MSKTKLLNEVISDLRKLANSIQAIADTFEADATPTEEKQIEPNSKISEPTQPVVSIEEIRAVLAGKSQDGKTAEVRALLQKYGANKLSEISAEVFPDLLKEAGEL